MTDPAHPGALPRRLRLGRRHRRVPDRGRRPRGRPRGRPSGTRSPRRPARSQRRHRRRRLRPLPPLPGGRRADARARARRVPLLDRAGRACVPGGPRRAQPARPRLLRPARRRTARRRHPAVASRSTTGTCRRRCEDAGGWPTATPAHRVRRVRRRSSYERLGDRVTRLDRRSTSRGASSFLGYAAGVHAPGRRGGRGAPSARRTTCCWRTAWPWRRCAPAGRRDASASRSTSTTSMPASDTRGRRRRRPAHRRALEPAVPRPVLRGATRPT